MSLLSFVFIAVGVVALVAGAEALVRGAAALAARSGLSPIVIGLTVVAFGTSAPELAVSVGAAVRDEAEIAIGNVVGSNIANVLLILGLSAMVGGALTVHQRIVRIDVPIVIAVSVLVLLFSLDNEIVRWEGLVLVALLITFITWTVIEARRESGTDLAVESEYDEALDPERLKATSPLLDLGLILLGLVLLIVGSQGLVSGATDIAESLGVSDLVIGLTVVAVGTSLPELATSVLAARRGQVDLAVGNVIGSNLFNLLAVLGLTATFSPSALPVLDGAIRIDIPIMIAVAIACLPIFANGYCVKRWEGTLFFLYYVAYTVWLILDASDHDLGRTYGIAMVGFVLPITALTLGIVGVRAWRDRPGAAAT
jgi:cation:H+ antiporter